MKNTKLIPKAKNGMKDLHDSRLKRDSGYRGPVDTYDNNTIQVNLPTVEIRPEGVELTDQDKYKQSYENLIYTLKSNGYNNLADDVQNVGQTQGIGNALHHYQDIINRRKDLLKSKGSLWTEDEAKKIGVAAMSIPYVPLAAIGAGKAAGSVIGNVVSNPVGFVSDMGIGMGVSATSNRLSKIHTGKTIYERAQERYPNDPVKAIFSGILRDPGSYIGLNTILRGKNAYKFTKDLVQAGGLKNYRIAKAITNNLDEAISSTALPKNVQLKPKIVTSPQYTDPVLINKNNPLYDKYRIHKGDNKIRISKDELLNPKNRRIQQIINDRSWGIDDFELVKKRLRDGGYDKLGISKDDWIIVPSNAYPNLGEPFGEGLQKVNAREFLENINIYKDNMVNDFEYSPRDKSIYLSRTFEGDYMPYKTENLIKAHEFGHAIDDVVASKNKPYLTKDYTPTTDIPGVDFSKDLEIKPYFTQFGGTELKQRYSQLLNYFNKNNSNLSLAEWNFAKNNYNFDNNMKEFFNVVTNPKEFIKHMSKIVPIGIGTIFGVNQFTKQ